MGEAKRRGTFEERKIKAIEAGRVKRRRASSKELEKAVMKDILTTDPLGIMSFIFTKHPGI